MKVPDQYRALLSTMEMLNEQYNAVSCHGKPEYLAHSFWTLDEIDSALDIRPGWDVPDHLLPFHGDWHDLICLDLQTAAIVMLDDSRNITCQWPDMPAFIADLRMLEGEGTGHTGIISVRLNF